MRTQVEKDTDALYERLVGDDFDGNVEGLAAEVGMTFDRVRAVLARVREPEFIDQNHWTIPYVRRGSFTNRFYVLRMEDQEEELTQLSQEWRTREMLATVKRNIGQSELALELIPDKRSRRAKHWSRVLTMFRAAEAHLELLLDL